MERLKFFKENENYSTSRGRWCKYFFNQNNEDGLIIIGETDDYFYFTISLKEGMLQDNYIIDLDENSLLYDPLNQLLQGFKLVDVFEEGSPERKSLCFEKQDKHIRLTFNLTPEQKVFYTIEFANLRRLGDTRFKNLVTDNKTTVDIEVEREFRYKFKVRLHHLLDGLEILCENNLSQQL